VVITGLTRCGRRLITNRRGAIGVFLALAAVPLIGFIGIGTDTARAFMVKSRLSTALDAAGLAGGKAFFSATRDADMTMYFNANFPAGYMGATVSGPDFVVDDANEKIELTASATVPTTFMRLFGYENITVAASAEISRQEIMLDVVLSIDMSGSMTTWTGGKTRIAAARDAATTLVEILFGDNATNPLLKIGLVPWNSKVNVMVEGQTYHPASPSQSTPPSQPVTGGGRARSTFADNTRCHCCRRAHKLAGLRLLALHRREDPATDADIFDGPTETAAPIGRWKPIGPKRTVSARRAARGRRNTECGAAWIRITRCRTPSSRSWMPSLTSCRRLDIPTFHKDSAGRGGC